MGFQINGKSIFISMFFSLMFINKWTQMNNKEKAVYIKSERTIHQLYNHDLTHNLITSSTQKQPKTIYQATFTH